MDQAIHDIQQVHWDIETLENLATVEPGRAALRHEQFYSGQSDVHSLDPNEFDPNDWINASVEQVGAIRDIRGKINGILDSTIQFCNGCATTLGVGWNFCPKCGAKPSNDPVRSFLRNSCVRCDRFDKLDHDLTWSHCPLHGLELVLKRR